MHYQNHLKRQIKEYVRMTSKVIRGYQRSKELPIKTLKTNIVEDFFFICSPQEWYYDLLS